MGDKSGIEWTDATWNPVVGCSILSPGCTNCYAMKWAAQRMDGAVAHYAGTTKKVNGNAVWTGKVALAPDHILTAPLRWRKPRRIFVNSMSDLFHESVPDEWIDQVFAVMALAPQHTFQCLTKRSARMRTYCRLIRTQYLDAADEISTRMWGTRGGVPITWPLPNVWLGVSAEDQTRADERIPDLLATPAAVRFVSAEPLLGPINFKRIASGQGWQDALNGWRQDCEDYPGRESLLDWIIVGGESGPGARPNWTPNVRSIVRQCKTAGVAVFVKQMGSNVQDRNDAGFDGCEPHEWPDVDPADVEHDVNGYREDYQGAACRIRLKDRKGGNMSEWPEDLRVQEFPNVA